MIEESFAKVTFALDEQKHFMAHNLVLDAGHIVKDNQLDSIGNCLLYLHFMEYQQTTIKKLYPAVR